MCTLLRPVALLVLVSSLLCDAFQSTSLWLSQPLAARRQQHQLAASGAHGMTEAHEGVQKFFETLPTSVYDPATHMLNLQTSFPTVYESNKIFVRQCYSELYDIIQSSATVGGFVITGTPGIGKSVCSLLHFLYKL
eukprot:13106-Heterococcus_DN1.PRE.1